jgi:chromosome segregation ATPase
MKDTTKTVTPTGKLEKPEKKTRTVLTPAQRVAKIEADLAAARAKLESKDRSAHADLLGKRAKLVERQTKINGELSAINAEIAAIEERVEDLSSTEPSAPTDS